MVKVSPENLIKKFPYFFNKSSTSNFYKSQSVTNNQLQNLYNSIFNLIESLRLDKRCLIWKEQEEAYLYNIHFVANYPNIKSIKCYKNEDLIYTEEYAFEEERDTFDYIYNSSSENEDIPSIIPQSRFSITVETYDGNILQKGFPENDEIMDDIYDHDESLDELGALNNIPRKNYIPTTDYPTTEPPYNDRLTEDDYHYMNRMIEYNLRLHDTPLPVLEIWKLYGLESVMQNRERLLLKVFDENRHPFDEEGHVQEWEPLPWEHKDGFTNKCEIDYGKYFFVAANTTFPKKGTGCIFYFKLLNNIAEEILDDEFTVKILLNDVTLAEYYNKKSYQVPYNLLNEGEGNYFKFICYNIDEEVLGEIELEVNVQGCNNADIYVSSTGDDTTGKGTINEPYLTLTRAFEDVNDIKQIIAVRGTVTTSEILLVNSDCTIIGCNVGTPGTVQSTFSPKIFNIVGNKNITLALVDINLQYGAAVSHITNGNYINTNNDYNNYLGVILQGGEPLIEVELDKSNYYYDYDNIFIEGILKSTANIGIPNAELQVNWNNTTSTITTGNDGTFTITLPIRKLDKGTNTLLINFEGSELYEETELEEEINITKDATAMEITYGDPCTLTGTGFTPGASVKLYSNNTLITTVTADENGAITYTYTPDFRALTIYSSTDGVHVDTEWVIKTSLTISELPFEDFITDITVDTDTSEVTVIKTPITDFEKISDLETVILDVSVDDESNICVHRFISNFTDETILNGDIIYPEDAEELLYAIQTLTVTEDADLYATYGGSEE